MSSTQFALKLCPHYFHYLVYLVPLTNFVDFLMSFIQKNTHLYFEEKGKNRSSQKPFHLVANKRLYERGLNKAWSRDHG